MWGSFTKSSCSHSVKECLLKDHSPMKSKELKTSTEYFSPGTYFTKTFISHRNFMKLLTVVMTPAMSILFS